MNDDKINLLVEKYYKKNKFSLSSLLEMIEEEQSLLENQGVLVEESGGRFSFVIDIPTWTPSEAWGDPDSQDRAAIQKIFSVVRGGTDMRGRIADINKFLDATAAARKRSPSVIINMMMIVEALQATLNDYNESAAGFVCEGFMAALTGGKQIAGKVAGTLPIEDFVAFSSYGQDQPVSLKLLSPSTPVKGSFTNIVDFLLVRGAPEIKYLVAYKLVDNDQVQKLKIFDFDITRENFIEFIASIGGGQKLLSGVPINKLRAAMSAFNSNPSKENLTPLATLIVQLGGYRRGLLHDYIDLGTLPGEREEDPEAAAAAAAKKKAGRERGFGKLSLDESLDRGEATLNEAFHYIEKQTMLEGKTDEKSQWSASFPQLKRLASLTNMQEYGEIDLSQDNIDKLSEIYAEKLKGGGMTLLTEAKALTENIGSYYTEKRRSKATAAASTALENTENISNVLVEDPRYK